MNNDETIVEVIMRAPAVSKDTDRADAIAFTANAMQNASILSVLQDLESFWG
jgi:hypothetical protein